MSKANKTSPKTGTAEKFSALEKALRTMKRLALVLFNDTIYNNIRNIRIGNMNASRGEVLAAAKAACCDEEPGRKCEPRSTQTSA